LLLSGTTTSYSYNAASEQLSATQGLTTFSSGTWNGAGELRSYRARASSARGEAARRGTLPTTTGA